VVLSVREQVALDIMGCHNGREANAAPKGGGGTGCGAGASNAAETKKADEKLLDKYSLGKVLGQGAFGVVYSCKRKGTNDEYAVKMIDQVETPVGEIKLEVDMLKRLAHPCVVKLHDVYFEKVFVCMVLEIYRGGDMIEGMQLHWKTKGMIAIPVIQNLSKQMFQSVEWLHHNKVIHRDLKGDNYLQDRKALQDPKCRVFLSDFGTVKDIQPGERLKSKCGTKTYWSPEFYSLNYGLKADVWALGVVIYGMVTGRFPFKGEEDVRKKPVKIPSRCGKDGEEFLLGTLNRDEEIRLSAAQAIDHRFLAACVSAAEAAEEALEKDFKPEVKEAGANAGVKERRRELVERLENAQARKSAEKLDIYTMPAQVLKGFNVYDKHHEKTATFEWWSPAQCAGFVDESKAVTLKEDDTASSVESSEHGIRQMLESHGIITASFGQGKAKKFAEFLEEVQKGQSRLMLDAAKHKNVVRVVDVVLLRIVHGSGPNKKYLIMTAEKYPDGRMRSDINQLSGAKKLPHENAMQTARRVVEERLTMKEAGIVFNSSSSECFEDDEDSPSYPGVRTVYRKEILEGTVTTTDAAVLERVGLPGRDHFQQEDSKSYTRYFVWLSEAQCIEKKIQFKAPAEGHEVSALVSPPIGFEEEALHAFLKANKVDVTRFGKDGIKTLAEFSEELVKGEAALIARGDGKVIRVVDVLVMKLAKKNGDIVVEVCETYADESKKELKRLPAVKRRTDENPFWAAHRVLSKVLKINENMVEMDASNVQVVEEETTSKAYADLPTLYRKRIVSAKLLED